MKNSKLRKNFSFILVPLMVLYVFIPCISQAAPVLANMRNPRHDAYHGANSIQPTGTITYFYNGSTLMNAEDDNGNMSTYLDRTVRTIVNVNTQTVLDTQCLFTDGKNVISQTDSTGTTVTSTQQYNAYGQPTNYNPPSNQQINKSTNQPLSISTNPFQYDGYYYDPESGLYYLNARYYSPTLMQFVSMDTYDLANRYGYCDGNPIDNEDPTGHMSNILNYALDAGGILASIGTIAFLGAPTIPGIVAILSVVLGTGSSSLQITSKFVKDKNEKQLLNSISFGLGVGSAIIGVLDAPANYLAFKYYKIGPSSLRISVNDIKTEDDLIGKYFISRKGLHFSGSVFTKGEDNELIEVKFGLGEHQNNMNLKQNAPRLWTDDVVKTGRYLSVENRTTRSITNEELNLFAQQNFYKSETYTGNNADLKVFDLNRFKKNLFGIYNKKSGLNAQNILDEVMNQMSKKKYYPFTNNCKTAQKLLYKELVLNI